MLCNDAQDPHALSELERLDIAIGSTEGLTCMHPHSGHNHVHGDIRAVPVKSEALNRFKTRPLLLVESTSLR
jgi:hypothetical protein